MEWYLVSEAQSSMREIITSVFMIHTGEVLSALSSLLLLAITFASCHGCGKFNGLNHSHVLYCINTCRYGLAAALFVLIFLMWMVFTTGLFCGVFGYSSKALPYERSHVSQCGARLLLLYITQSHYQKFVSLLILSCWISYAAVLHWVFYSVVYFWF